METDYKNEVIGLIKGDNFFKIPKSFVRKFGLTQSLYLCCLIEWEEFLKMKFGNDPDHNFFMTQAKIKERTYLSEHQQEYVLRKLMEYDVLSVRRGGKDNKNFYQINFKLLHETLMEPIGEISYDFPLVPENSVPEKLGTKNELGARKVGHPISKIYLKPKESEIEDDPKGSSIGANAPPTVGLSILLKRKKNIPIVFELHSYRKDVMKVISYWNSSPGLPHLAMPGNGRVAGETKSLKNIVEKIGQVLDGKFSEQWPAYSVEEVIKAIDGFKLRLTNPDYSPVNKQTLKSINLDGFFYNPFSKQIESMFIECIKNPPKLLKNIVPKEQEKNPVLTKWLQKFYTDRILLGQPRTFNQIEINKFIKGANLLSDSISSLRKRANLMTGPMEFCEYVIEALIKNWGEAEIRPGHVGSEWTYTELLPRYLKELGRID